MLTCSEKKYNKINNDNNNNNNNNNNKETKTNKRTLKQKINSNSTQSASVTLF